MHVRLLSTQFSNKKCILLDSERYTALKSTFGKSTGPIGVEVEWETLSPVIKKYKDLKYIKKREKTTPITNFIKNNCSKIRTA